MFVCAGGREDVSRALAYAKQAGHPSAVAPAPLHAGGGARRWGGGPLPSPGHPSGAALPAWPSPAPAARRNLTRKWTGERLASGFQACPGPIDFGSESVVPGRGGGGAGSPADAAAWPSTKPAEPRGYRGARGRAASSAAERLGQGHGVRQGLLGPAGRDGEGEGGAERKANLTSGTKGEAPFPITTYSLGPGTWPGNGFAQTGTDRGHEG